MNVDYVFVKMVGYDATQVLLEEVHLELGEQIHFTLQASGCCNLCKIGFLHVFIIATALID